MTVNEGTFMDPVSKVVQHKNPDFGKGVIIDYDYTSDPDNQKITVRFDSKDLRMKYPEAFEEFLTCEDSEFQVEVDQLIANKKLAEAVKKEKEQEDTFSINRKPVKAERDSYYSNYPYRWSKSGNTRKKDDELSRQFPTIKRVIKNANYDIKQFDVAREAPEDKAQYTPKRYDNPWDQACYILRYSYAYAFEYYLLYIKILNAIGNIEELNVLSIGCGPQIDAWSLGVASKTKKFKAQINYSGVDLAKNWREDYHPRTEYIKVNQPVFGVGAGRFLMSCDTLDYNMIVFPKSLRDIYYNKADADFYRIKTAFETRPITKDFVCIAFSLSNNPGETEEEQRVNEELLKQDYEKIDELIGSVKKQGYVVKGSPIVNTISSDRVYDNTGYPELEDWIKNEVFDLTGRYMMTNRCYQKFIAYILEKEK